MRIQAVKRRGSSCATTWTGLETDAYAMTHMERISALLNGKPLDRLPCAAWSHVMNFCDRNAKDFAKATIDFQNACDFDFVKIMSNPYYMLEDMGLLLTSPSVYTEPVMRREPLPVQSPDDWDRAAFPECGRGTLAREREAIARVVEHFRGEVPVIATIFTPLMWVAYAALSPAALDEAERRWGCSTPLLERYAEDNEPYVRAALDRFAAINQEYMESLISVGVSGFFYCTEHARDAWQDAAAFESFEGRYDRETLGAVFDRSLMNVMHVCGVGRLKPSLVLDYPVHAFNWEDQALQNPSLADVRGMTDRILVGGLDRLHDFEGADRAEIKERIRQKIEEAQRQAGRNLIVSGGCDWKIDAVFRFYIWQEVMEELGQLS